MPDDDEDRITAAKKVDLPAAAVASVTDAISRGVNRRVRREQNLGRTPKNLRNIPLPTSIIVGARPNGYNINGDGAPRYIGSSSLPYAHLTAESESDEDDSNDEWEEAVCLDARTAKRAVRKREKLAQREAQRLAKEADGKDGDTKGETPREEKDKPSEEVLEKAKKHAVKQFNSAERSKCNRLFDMHMTLLLSNIIRMDTAASDAELQAIALSLIPDDVLNSTNSAGTERGFRESLARFALWSRAYFRPRALFPPPRTKRPASQIQRSIRALNLQNAHVFDIAVALAAALRGINYRTRIVVPIQPYHYTPRKPPANLAATPSKKGKSPKKTKVSTVSGDKQRERAALGILRELQRDGADMYAWLEVWCPTEKKWLPVDFFNGTIDIRGKSQIIASMRGHAEELLQRAKTYKEDLAKLNAQNSSKNEKKGGSSNNMNIEELVNTIDVNWLARIVAAEGGVLTDVTRRYISKWKAVEKERSKGRPVEVFLEQFSASRHDGDDDRDEAARCEEKLFDTMASNDEIPTSINALHKHPRFVLERHLKKYETVHPKEPVGYFKEEAIYLRSTVIVLHSRERWRREMKQVAPDAIPLKEVKSVNREKEEKTALFGVHQCVALVIPPVVDGKVPRGERGNLELWTPEHVPAGGTHLPGRYCAAAARALSIDYVEAMTGFDVRSRRSVPRIEGIVVAEEYAEAVRLAAGEKERQARQRAEDKAKEEAQARWKGLLKAMLARSKVRKKYGDDTMEAGSYLAVQKKQGVKRAREEKMQELGHRAKKAKSDGEEEGKEEAEMDLSRYDKKSHVHAFVKERIDDEDGEERWLKTCTICKLTVAIDKL